MLERVEDLEHCIVTNKDSKWALSISYEENDVDKAKCTLNTRHFYRPIISTAVKEEFESKTQYAFLAGCVYCSFVHYFKFPSPK